MADGETVALIDEFFDLVRDFATRHRLTYREYDAVMSYIISIGDAGEWPLFLDAFFESWINKNSYGEGDWTSTAITGPFYKPGAPVLGPPYRLPMRADESGDPLAFHTRVTDRRGEPIEQAEVDVWHCTTEGIYSFFDARLPDEYVLRGRVRTNADGQATFYSIVPVPYEIPKGGPTGKLMNDVLGRHSWRPAHLHFTVTAPGYQSLTTQLYFKGDPYLESDCVSAVKSQLVIDLADTEIDGRSGREGRFTFVLRDADATVGR